MKLSRRRASLTIVAGGVLAPLGFSPAHARAPEIYIDDGGLFGQGWKHAVGGYDAVAYHSLGEDDAPVPGSEDLQTEYKGVSWLFSSQENLDAFKAEPDRYRPHFGGYCAWAMARNKLAKGDPEVWHIHESVLYLNVSPRFKREWLANLERDLMRGNENWPGILERN